MWLYLSVSLLLLSISPPGIPKCESVEWFTHHLSDKCDFLFSPTQEMLRCTQQLWIFHQFCVKTYCTQKCLHLNIWELNWRCVWFYIPISSHMNCGTFQTGKLQSLLIFNFSFQPYESVTEQTFTESSRRFPKQITVYLKGITFIAWLNDCFWT